MCGRLRCCLVYEYEHYVEARKQLPKRGKLMITPRGNGKVLDVNPLKGAVLIELDQGGIHEFMQDELQPSEELDALKQNVGGSCENCPEDKRPVDKRPDMRRGKKRPHARPR
jgi:cell fate regulator YaaT (PSP1 superfamily)